MDFGWTSRRISSRTGFARFLSTHGSFDATDCLQRSQQAGWNYRDYLHVCCLWNITAVSLFTEQWRSTISLLVFRWITHFTSIAHIIDSFWNLDLLLHLFSLLPLSLLLPSSLSLSFGSQSSESTTGSTDRKDGESAIDSRRVHATAGSCERDQGQRSRCEQTPHSHSPGRCTRSWGPIVTSNTSHMGHACPRKSRSIHNRGAVTSPDGAPTSAGEQHNASWPREYRRLQETRPFVIPVTSPSFTVRARRGRATKARGRFQRKRIAPSGHSRPLFRPTLRLLHSRFRRRSGGMREKERERKETRENETERMRPARKRAGKESERDPPTSPRTTPTRVRQRPRLATRVHPRARSFSAMWRPTSFRCGVASPRVASFSLCAPPPPPSTTHLRSVASYWFALSSRAQRASLRRLGPARISPSRGERATPLLRAARRGAARRRHVAG